MGQKLGPTCTDGAAATTAAVGAISSCLDWDNVDPFPAAVAPGRTDFAGQKSSTLHTTPWPSAAKFADKFTDL